MDEVWENIVSCAAHLDAVSPYPQEQQWLLQLLKIGEESGEAAQAAIGVMGTNPRKGISHTWADVRGEVMDVAITALVALARMCDNPREEFERHLALKSGKTVEAARKMLE